MTTMEMSSPPPEAQAGYPVRLSITRPDKQSRVTNFPFYIGTFIRAIIAIPHFVILYFFQIVAQILYFIATFAILFTGRYPEGMYRFFAGYLRWAWNLNAYLYDLHDKYPPFSTDDQADYPVHVQIDYPSSSSRWLNFPILGIIVKAILLIPHWIVVAFLGLVSAIIIFIAQFAILFTGSFPEGMHGFVVGYARWSLRVQGYLYAMTDKYPPFSMS